MNTSKLSIRLCLLACLPLVAACTEQTSSSRSLEPVTLPEVEALGVKLSEVALAQGQLEPAGGVIPIVAPAGDRIAELSVAEGATVTKDKPVGRLVGRSIREAELQVARTELAEGQKRVDAEEQSAEAERRVAEVGIKAHQRRLQEAEEELRLANQEGGQLQLLQRKVELAEDKLAQLRNAAAAPEQRRLVSASAVQQQELAVQAAQAELEAASRNAESAVEAARLMLEAANSELAAAGKKFEAAVAGAALGSSEEKVKLLELQLQAASLNSPIDGTVLAVDASVGQPTTGMPIMRIADLSQMICRAEVRVADLPSIQLGARAAISGGGLSKVLQGEVISISQVVGTPRLPSADPRTRVDWRSAEVVIAIDPADTEAASRLVQSQVDVAIKKTEP